MTWFQHHPDNPPPADEDETPPDWDAPDSAKIEDAELVEDETLDADEYAGADPAPAPQDKPEDAAAQPTERRPLDSTVAEVLRAEAERERAARAADAGGGLETQPELGLGEGRAMTAPPEPAYEDEKRSSEAQARMARLRGEDTLPDAQADPDPDPGTRRNLLPDIDEINSSLDSDPTDPGMVETDTTGTPAGGTGGFRRGFLSVVILAVIGLLLYVFAPQLVRAVPALDGLMSGYVGMVDAARAQLDQLLGGGAG